jgi:hypothetical protein
MRDMNKFYKRYITACAFFNLQIFEIKLSRFGAIFKLICKFMSTFLSFNAFLVFFHKCLCYFFHRTPSFFYYLAPKKPAPKKPRAKKARVKKTRAK